MEGWPCANCRSLGGHWYEGEPVPGMCIPNGLPVDLEEPLPFEWDTWRVLHWMLGLVEGGRLPTVEELVKKLEEGQEEEEGEEQGQEEQGEQPPATNEAGPSAAPALVEVRPMGPLMPLGEEAQEERREAPTSRSARGKEHAVQAMPPLKTDEEMVRHLQAQEEEEEEVSRGQDAATLVVVREAAGPMMRGQVEGLEAPS